MRHLGKKLFTRSGKKIEDHLSDDVIDAALLLLVHVGDVGGASGDVGERVDHESGIWKSMDY